MQVQSRRPLTLTIALCLILLLSAAAPAADMRTKEKQRPKIGLVLSGGGARGIAHVGVLRRLEEMRVPVDFIAGTSMGAVVGGLYASGMSLDEIEKQVLSTDWNALMNDRTSHSELSFRGKQAATRNLCQIEMGIRDRRIHLPEGLVTGRKMAFMLESLTLPAAGIRDFDRLPIPFRAVATDIVTGLPVVFASGRLSQAIRASMAVPGVFAPIEDKGRLLVDGGISRNLPVSTAQEMGADIVIAVDISTQPLGKDDIRTLMDISRQVIALTVNRNTAGEIGNMKDGDILIRPELSHVRNKDFRKARASIEAGYEAASEKSGTLSGLALPEAEYTALRTKQKAPNLASLRIDYLNIPTPSRLHPAGIQHLVRSRPDSNLDLDVLREDLARLYATGEFEDVNFDFAAGNNWNGLIINIKDKSWGPNYLQFGLDATSDLEGSNYYNVRARLRKTCINSMGGEWQTDVQAGNTRLLQTEFYQPLTHSGLFFARPFLSASQEPAPVFSGKDRRALYSIENLKAGLEAGLMLGRFAQLSAALEVQSLRTNLEIGSETFPEESLRDCAAVVRADIDTIDNFNFPRHGLKLGARLAVSRPGLGSELTYERLSGEFMQAMSEGKNTLVLAADFGSAMGGELPFHALFRSGGFLNLSGLRVGQKAGPYAGTGRLVVYRQLGKLPPVVGDGIYAGISLEAGNVWDEEIDSSDLMMAGSVFAGLDTILGPLYIAYGRAQENNDAVYIYLGRPI